MIEFGVSTLGSPLWLETKIHAHTHTHTEGASRALAQGQGSGRQGISVVLMILLLDSGKALVSMVEMHPDANPGCVFACFACSDRLAEADKTELCHLIL